MAPRGTAARPASASAHADAVLQRLAALEAHGSHERRSPGWASDWSGPQHWLDDDPASASYQMPSASRKGGASREELMAGCGLSLPKLSSSHACTDRRNAARVASPPLPEGHPADENCVYFPQRMRSRRGLTLKSPRAEPIVAACPRTDCDFETTPDETATFNSAGREDSASPRRRARRSALAAECTVASADDLKSGLAELVTKGKTVTLDVRAVQRIDTAGLQLLAAFCPRPRSSGLAGVG